MISVLIFVFGLCLGSFLNCFIYRLRKKQSILGRSYCPDCKTKIAWYDNIPLLSFILLKGKCRHCRKKISWQYPLVELVTAVLFLIIWQKYKIDVDSFTRYSLLVTRYSKLIRDWLFVCILIVIFIYDLRWQLILDKITLPAMVIAFGLNIWLGISWQNLLLAGIIGGGFFLTQYLISRGRWIGGGDIRLGVLMGLMLGWPQIIVALMLAYISGAIVGIGLILGKKKQWSSHIPFGTFLSAATIVAMLWGEEILSWYPKLILF